jgi:hypothetical protein
MEAVLPELRAHHLVKTLTGPYGLFEHALLDRPRQDHGYTTDDNARALVVLSRAFPEVDVRPYLDFVIRGRIPGGWHNRMSQDGRWTDRRGSDDAHGRALWGLGCAVRHGEAERALPTLLSGLDLDTAHARANAYATLGAVEAMAAEPGLTAAEDFLRRVADRLPRPSSQPWMWPEPRLTYANARLPEALMAAGRALGDEALVSEGLRLLDWLVGVEHGENGFSFTPVGGRGPESLSPGFDQQPIEAWAMADACLLAFEIEGGERWATATEDAAMWVMGRNDTHGVLYDPATGAGFDGLEADGVNQNRGAESTLAVLGALDALRRLQESRVA